MDVNFYATLRPIVGGKTVEFPLPEGTTVQALLDAIVGKYPAMREELLDAEGQLYPHVHLFINGRDAPYLDAGMDTVLTARDKVDLFPAVAGG
ncbi:MAG: ubiquitin-like small modifier protein 1 [Planctomycetota bacterium]